MDFRAGDIIYHEAGDDGGIVLLLEITLVEHGFFWVKYVNQEEYGEASWCVPPARWTEYSHAMKVFEVGDRIQHKSSLNEYVVTGITEDGVEIDGLPPKGPRGQFFSKHRENDRWVRLLPDPSPPRIRQGRKIL